MVWKGGDMLEDSFLLLGVPPFEVCCLELFRAGGRFSFEYVL